MRPAVRPRVAQQDARQLGIPAAATHGQPTHMGHPDANAGQPNHTETTRVRMRVLHVVSTAGHQRLPGAPDGGLHGAQRVQCAQRGDGADGGPNGGVHKALQDGGDAEVVRQHGNVLRGTYG